MNAEGNSVQSVLPRRLTCFLLPPLLFLLLVLAPTAAHSYTCGKKGYWVCNISWSAGTTFRSMSGTNIECGGGLLFIPGYCGDTSHSQPNTWVDIVGGVSQSCEDHSTSFYGPYSGEWNGCTWAYQQSTGYQPIPGVNQQASFWPFGGGYQDVWDDGYCYNPFEDPPHPPYVWYYYPASFTVAGAFASVYDLDYCVNKQLMGTIYWPSFSVTSQITTDDPEHKIVNISGSAASACATKQSSCENDTLCSDLVVSARQECTWYWYEPQTRCDMDCQYY